MKVYRKSFFDKAQEWARDAVEHGTKEGYGLDWASAMVFLKLATGHATLGEYMSHYKEFGAIYESEEG